MTREQITAEAEAYWKQTQLVTSKRMTHHLTEFGLFLQEKHPPEYEKRIAELERDKKTLEWMLEDGVNDKTVKR